MTEHAGYIRPQFRTVTPYLTVRGAAGLIDFIARVFGGEELRRDLRPDGTILNAEMRVGDSLIELSEAGGSWQPRPGALHVYVPDTDAAYRRALDAGAASLYEPADMEYGERSAGVEDPSGNYWYIATFQAGA
ncbi:MAG TPA: VOC family protein [Herpetosiphonaceae bacterium]